MLHLCYVFALFLLCFCFAHQFLSKTSQGKEDEIAKMVRVPVKLPEHSESACG